MRSLELADRLCQEETKKKKRTSAKKKIYLTAVAHFVLGTSRSNIVLKCWQAAHNSFNPPQQVLAVSATQSKYDNFL
jgi:RecA-family ATPase